MKTFSSALFSSNKVNCKSNGRKYHPSSIGQRAKQRFKGITISFYFMLISFGLLILNGCNQQESQLTSMELGSSIIPRETSEDSTVLDLLGTYCFDPSIFNAGSGCNDTLYQDTVSIVNLPSYPGCTFTVVFKYLRCSAAGLLDISISDFQIIDHNCAAFSNDISTVMSASIFSNFIQNFDLEMYSAIEQHFISTINMNNYRCGFGAFVLIKFFTASCYRYCIAELPSGTLNSMTKATCGTECCEHQTKYCKDQFGVIIAQPDDTPFAYPPICDGESILDQLLPCRFSSSNKIKWETPCTFRCFPRD